MPNYDTCYRLWKDIAYSLVHVGGIGYRPEWSEVSSLGPRHDAHLYATRQLLEPMLNAYSEIRWGKDGK